MYNKRQRTSHKTHQTLKLCRNYVSPGTYQESLEVPVAAAADLDTWNPTHAVMGQLSGADVPVTRSTFMFNAIPITISVGFLKH